LFDVYIQTLNAIATITASAKNAMIAIVNGFIFASLFVKSQSNDQANNEVVLRRTVIAVHAAKKYQYATL